MALHFVDCGMCCVCDIAKDYDEYTPAAGTACSRPGIWDTVQVGECNATKLKHMPQGSSTVDAVPGQWGQY